MYVTKSNKVFLNISIINNIENKDTENLNDVVTDIIKNISFIKN